MGLMLQKNNAESIAEHLVSKASDLFIGGYTKHLIANFVLLAIEWKEGRQQKATIYDVYLLYRYERLAWQAVKEVCNRYNLILHMPAYFPNGLIQRKGRIEEPELLEDDLAWLGMIVEQYLNRDESKVFIARLEEDLMSLPSHAHGKWVALQRTAAD